MDNISLRVDKAEEFSQSVRNSFFYFGEKSSFALFVVFMRRETDITLAKKVKVKSGIYVIS